ncbi:MAG: restriction endonuclease subunit S [Synergistaceae bacterium]|jgi:type I restriction enzyme S subunit|nr:restriction endonuclease subunit S [Synergistaceae bacterium]
MSKWNTVLLSDIADTTLGKMLNKEKNCGEYEPYLANINVRWGSFDIENLSKMRFENHEQEKYGLKKGDLVVCEGGEPGRCAIWHGEIEGMKIQKALHRVRAKNGLDIRFLYYWFLMASRAGLLIKNFTGSTIKHLPEESLRELEVRVPDQQTQANISNVLSIIDDKIQLNNTINAELEKVAKTLYDYWFVQFDFPNAEGKPYRASGGEMVYNKILKREIPKGWKSETVKNCVSQIRTGLNPRQNFALGQGENQYITIKNIENGKLDFSKCDFVDDDALRKIHNRSDISVGDILFTSIEPVGRLYRIWEQPQNWDINESVFSIRTDTDVVSIDYLYAAMDSDLFRAMAIPLRTGSVQKGIRIGDLEAMKIVIPDDNVMERFSKRIRPIYEKRGLIEKENSELTCLRDFLLPLLMNGQVTVAVSNVR